MIGQTYPFLTIFQKLGILALIHLIR